VRPRSHVAFQGRQFPRAGRRGDGRRETRSFQAVENGAGHRPHFSGSRRACGCCRVGLESVREVLLANMLGEQPLPIDFRGKPPLEPKAAPVRVISE
jgi:hypothetical protein